VSHSYRRHLRGHSAATVFRVEISPDAMMEAMPQERATAPPSTSSMKIVDLRQTTVRQLEPLLEEETRHWHDELHWDYRSALDLIRRFLEAHALCGSVAFEGSAPAGYSFYVLE
jgi:hypothetical protein